MEEEPLTDKRQLLFHYVGQNYSPEIILKINNTFSPYTVTLCDIDTYNLENFWENEIRCVVEDNKIAKLSFN